MLKLIKLIQKEINKITPTKLYPINIELPLTFLAVPALIIFTLDKKISKMIRKFNILKLIINFLEFSFIFLYEISTKYTNRLEKMIQKRDRRLLHRVLAHFLMLVGFLAGGCVLTICCFLLGEKAIWIAMVPLSVNFIMLLYADLIKEHDLLWKVPRGH